ncbi:MAG: hypothetical protein N3E37_03545 [Candidatus Micrarchaeota archaeon]|nr:hypothetical protein [Candidatus Micrarchaeota archaeon]
MLNYRKRKFAFLLYILCIFQFASNFHSFEFSINDKVVDKPVIFKDNLIIITESGRIISYNLNDDSNQIKNSVSIGEKLKAKPGIYNKYVTLIGDNLIHVYNLDTLKKEFSINKSILSNSTILYGLSNGSHLLILDENKLSIFPAVQKTHALWSVDLSNFANRDIKIDPHIQLYGNFELAGLLINENFFIFDLNNRGMLKFNYSTGKIYKSYPILLNQFDIIYANTEQALTKRSLSTIYWQYYPQGSINSKLQLYNSILGSFIVFFTSDGSLYSIYPNGKLFWKRKIGAINDIDTDNELIAVAFSNNILLLNSEGNTKGAFNLKNDVKYVLLNKNKVVGVIRNSANNYRIKSFNVEPSCFIDYPKHRDQLTPGDTIFIGKYYYSGYDKPTVFLRVNNKDYKVLLLSDTNNSNISNFTSFFNEDFNNTWYVEINKDNFDLGSNMFQCVIYANNQQYTSEPLIISQTNKGLDRNLVVEVPSTAFENSEFTLKVFSEFGLPLNNVSIEFDGKVSEFNHTITLNTGSAGRKAIVINKDGYKKVVKSIEIISFQPYIILISVTILFVLGIILIIKG